MTDGQAAPFAPERLPQARHALELVVRAYEDIMLAEDLVGGHEPIVYDARVDVKAEQRARLAATVEWAKKIRTVLQPVLDANGSRVHFRPSSGGVAMVGLLHDRPQRGKSGIRNLEGLAKDFERMFVEHCRDVDHGRATGEKALQSALIREAYGNGRWLASVNAASASTDDPVELMFVTDEIPLPVDGGRMVCDVLALRRDGGRSTPVLLELKDDRMLTRLVEQVEGYAALVDAHADLFATLFGALLGEDVRFDGPTEKWIVWPAAGATIDPREDDLAAKNVRVVGYKQNGDGAYAMRVGRRGTRTSV